MKATDKLDICDNVLRICRIVGIIDAVVTVFCITYRKGAIDAIHEFQSIVTPGGKYANAVDEMERSIKNK